MDSLTPQIINGYEVGVADLRDSYVYRFGDGRNIIRQPQGWTPEQRTADVVDWHARLSRGGNAGRLNFHEN